jgi:ribulose-5-phosphate 4-epimerase/fuculose-1-phosphate aldolase
MHVPQIASSPPVPSPPAAERELRIDLAAAYRLIALQGWDDDIANHISVRVPGPGNHFLINPFGVLFEEITASMLVKVDLEGNIVDGGTTDLGINKAGFVIHSAIHAAREQAHAIVHCHTIAGTAVSAQKQGLLPIGPLALLLLGKVAYHDFEGITVDEDEKPRIVADLGDKWALILRNHGTISVGRTIPQAYQRMYWLERSCQQQVAALAGGRELTLPPQAMADRVQLQNRDGFADLADRSWSAQLRRLDRIDPGFRN